MANNLTACARIFSSTVVFREGVPELPHEMLPRAAHGIFDPLNWKMELTGMEERI